VFLELLSNEVIFSNICVTEDNRPYWNDSGEQKKKKGRNYSGDDWFLGKKDEQGKEIKPSHKNSRFTFSLDILDNVDENLHKPEGVELKGIIYGGRDSDTSVPVEEAFNWDHGIITKGAALESETTAATLGAVGKRVFNPMSNIDFLSIPIADYIQDNLNFGKKVDNPPKIFSVNYFIKDKQGNYLNAKTDKAIWVKWMELRTHDEVETVTTPTGLIPRYEAVYHQDTGKPL